MMRMTIIVFFVCLPFRLLLSMNEKEIELRSIGIQFLASFTTCLEAVRQRIYRGAALNVVRRRR